MKQKNENPEYDDRLAEFTDEVLEGKNDRPDANADDELRALEETILRLNRALPHTDVNKVSLRHLEARLKASVHRKLEQGHIPIWQKWFGRRHGQFRVRGPIAAALFLFVIVALLINKLYPPNASEITAVAFTGSNIFVTLAVLAGIILLAIGISRRK